MSVTLYNATFIAGFAVIGLGILFFLMVITRTVTGKVSRWRERRRDIKIIKESKKIAEEMETRKAKDKNLKTDAPATGT